MVTDDINNAKCSYQRNVIGNLVFEEQLPMIGVLTAPKGKYELK